MNFFRINIILPAVTSLIISFADFVHINDQTIYNNSGNTNGNEPCYNNKKLKLDTLKVESNLFRKYYVKNKDTSIAHYFIDEPCLNIKNDIIKIIIGVGDQSFEKRPMLLWDGVFYKDTINLLFIPFFQKPDPNVISSLLLIYSPYQFSLLPIKSKTPYKKVTINIISYGRKGVVNTIIYNL